MSETKPTSKGRTKAPAAGGGHAGTTQAAPTPTQLAAEDAHERELMIAEALAPASVSVSGELLPGVLSERPATSDPGTAVGPLLAAVRVRALSPNGFRRAGRWWGPETVEVPADDLSEAQITALLDEPLLHVTLIGEGDIEAAAAEGEHF